MAATVKPLGQALDVRGFAGTVDAFKTDKPSLAHESLTLFGQTALILVDCVIVLVQ